MINTTTSALASFLLRLSGITPRATDTFPWLYLFPGFHFFLHIFTLDALTEKRWG